MLFSLVVTILRGTELRLLIPVRSTLMALLIASYRRKKAITVPQTIIKIVKYRGALFLLSSLRYFYFLIYFSQEACVEV